MNSCISDLALEIDFERRNEEYEFAQHHNLLRTMREDGSSVRPIPDSLAGDSSPRPLSKKSQAQRTRWQHSAENHRRRRAGTA